MSLFPHTQILPRDYRNTNKTEQMECICYFYILLSFVWLNKFNLEKEPQYYNVQVGAFFAKELVISLLLGTYSIYLLFFVNWIFNLGDFSVKYYKRQMKKLRG